MKSVSFHVPGKPQGKARARTVHNKNLGHSISYTPENDLLYENLIKAMYIAAAKGTRFDKDIPVTLRIVARFEPPKSTSRDFTKRVQANGATVKPVTAAAKAAEQKAYEADRKAANDFLNQADTSMGGNRGDQRRATKGRRGGRRGI